MVYNDIHFSFFTEYCPSDSFVLYSDSGVHVFLLMCVFKMNQAIVVRSVFLSVF